MTSVASEPRAGTDLGLRLVAPRSVVVGAPVVWFALKPGDRPLVGPGETVLAGAPLAELLHDRRLAVVGDPAGTSDARPGGRWTGQPGGGRIGPRRRNRPQGGERLFQIGSRWRVATGESGGLLEAPLAGIVREVRPGVGISMHVEGAGIPGVQAVGAPARGRMELAAGTDGEVRATGLDVGRAGAVLVVSGRVDAETLTRARAMGIRGIVVNALTAKDLRDFAASEARQRASLHQLPPFAVLVLDGAIRRTVPSPIRAALTALTGHDVAIAGDPPMLLFDPGNVRVPRPPAGLVRVRQGAWGGREGQWEGLAGIRRFRGGVRSEAGFVRFDDGPPVALPLGDLERFV